VNIRSQYFKPNLKREKKMRALDTQEINVVAGGCGPGMFDGLAEAVTLLFGVSVGAAFVVGIASVYAYQYTSTYFKN
jgi:hypothetical protein